MSLNVSTLCRVPNPYHKAKSLRPLDLAPVPALFRLLRSNQSKPRWMALARLKCRASTALTVELLISFSFRSLTSSQPQRSPQNLEFIKAIVEQLPHRPIRYR